MYFQKTASYTPTSPISYGASGTSSYAPVSSSYNSSGSNATVMSDDMCRGACGTKYGCARCRTSA